jgi:hypothetical protein
MISMTLKITSSCLKQLITPLVVSESIVVSGGRWGNGMKFWGRKVDLVNNIIIIISSFQSFGRDWDWEGLECLDEGV